MSKVLRTLIYAIIAAHLVSAKASAGPFIDAFSKCIVRETSTHDRNNLIKWIFSAVSEHPVLTTLIEIPSRKRDMIDATAASLVTRVFTQSCKKEVIDIYKLTID